MSLYAINKDGQIVETSTGRIIDLSDEEAWLDRKDLYPPPSAAMTRMVAWIIRESKYQSDAG